MHLLMVRSPGSLAEMASTDFRETQECADNSPRTARTEVSPLTNSTPPGRLCSSAPRQHRYLPGKTEGHSQGLGLMRGLSFALRRTPTIRRGVHIEDVSLFTILLPSAFSQSRITPSPVLVWDYCPVRAPQGQVVSAVTPNPSLIQRRMIPTHAA